MAVLDVIESEGLVERAASAETLIIRRFDEIAVTTDRVKRSSVIGMLGSLELDVGDLDDAPGELLRVRHECLRARPRHPRRPGWGHARDGLLPASQRDGRRARCWPRRARGRPGGGLNDAHH